MELIDIVMKLNGAILPVGETHTDEKRLENLITAEELLMELIEKIDDVRFHHKDAFEYSRKLAAQNSAKALKRAYDYIGEQLGLDSLA